MKVLIIYDTLYGSTEQVAKSIGGGIGGEVKVQKVGEANVSELASYDLVIIGSPTQGGKQTVAMIEFLGKIPEGALKGKSVAAFDTRGKGMFYKIFGWAAARIAEALKEKGGNLIAPAEGFFVKSPKGPVAEGEAERAAAWAKNLITRKT